MTACPAAPTVADGIAVARPGVLTLAMMRRLLDDIVCVNEESITGAMVALLERSKLVVEGAGAVGVAALDGGLAASGLTTAVVLSGGNIDMNLLGRVVEHGLTHAGRYIELRVALDDRPGRLAALLNVLAAAGANVLAVEHHRAGVDLGFGWVYVDLVLEARNRDHVEDIVQVVLAAGFRERAASATPIERIFVPDSGAAPD
ncbi:MAG: pyridoxal-phosphate dependent enzyme [Dehalococcoidia bacterium]